MALFDKFKNKKRDKNPASVEQEGFNPTAEEESAEGLTPPAEIRPEENAADRKTATEEQAELTEVRLEAESQEPQEAETQSDAAQDRGRKGIFERFKQGLSKTRQNIGGKIDTLIKSTKKLDDEFFDELEEILIQADVGMNTSLDLVAKVRAAVKKQKINDPQEVNHLIKDAIKGIMDTEQVPLNSAPEKPTVILVVGVNGAGKTTSIAKLANKYKQAQHKVILAAGDTFRAAAIDQLQIWADRVGVELIKHQEGSDPGAVVFDAISAARARKADILIIDTAGRLQNKTNLMKEISKIRKVIEKEMPGAPHEVLLVLDATTGQNAISQARIFSEATGVTGIVLTKLDGTAKGGIVIAVAKELGIPVKLVGIGEGMEDLREFSPEIFAQALFDND